MVVYTNKELSETVQKIIADNGTKKVWIAEKIGMANQNINSMFKKSSFSIDDANKVLALFGYKATVIIEKIKEDE